MSNSRDIYQEQLSQFFTDRMQDHINAYRKESQEYNNLRVSNAQKIQRVEEILDTLPMANKEFIYSFIDDSQIAQSMEENVFYLQGYRDCIKLLRILHMLS